METKERPRNPEAEWPEVREPLTSQPGEFRVLELLVVLAKRRRFIWKALLVGIVLAVLVAVFLPKKYEAATRLLTPQQNQSISSAILTQLGPLAGLAGKDLGIHNQTEVFIALLHSRTVADSLIGRFSLQKIYGKRNLTDTRKRLDGVTEIVAGKEGVISIAVRDPDPDRAAALANAYVEELRAISQTLAVTEAGRRRMFFEREVKLASDELATAEQALKQTQESTGMLQIDSQSKALIEAYMSLRAQVAAKEVQVASMSGFATPENPDLVRAQQELAALRAQVVRFEHGQGDRSGIAVPLEKVPAAGLEYIRRLRELKYRETLFELLLKQYEIARIDESKDAAIIQVIDPAMRPEVQVRDWLMRLLIGLLIAFFGLIAGIGGALTLEALESGKKNSDYSAQMQLLKFYLSQPRRSEPVLEERPRTRAVRTGSDL